MTKRRFTRQKEIANVYEARVIEADKMLMRFLNAVEEATELSLLERQQSETTTKLAAHLTDSRKSLIGAMRYLSEWRALWPAEIVKGQLPDEMSDWLRTRQQPS